MGVLREKVFFCEQRIAGVSAALPRLSLKQVSAERTEVRTTKERMNFMGLFSVVVNRAAPVVVFVCSPPGMT